MPGGTKGKLPVSMGITCCPRAATLLCPPEFEPSVVYWTTMGTEAFASVVIAVRVVSADNHGYQYQDVQVITCKAGTLTTPFPR